MKLPILLPGLFTFILCLCLGNLNAQQCKKYRSSAENHSTEKAAEQKDLKYARQSCAYKSYYSCNKSKSRYTEKQSLKKYNFIGALVGVASNLDTDQNSFTTGLGYERKISSRIGLGLTSEVNFGDNTGFLFSVPLSLYASKRIKIFAGPLSSIKEENVADRKIPSGSDDISRTAKEWNTNFGIRGGFSYQLTTRGLRLAPAIMTDYVDSQLSLRMGLIAGFGF